MTVSQVQSGRQRRTQRGVSLIEVLVVLVILVTGILTIIRLFPSGFFSIQSTGNAALANSLGGAAINLGEQSSGSLPDAILPDDPMMDDLANAVTNSAAYSNYDPDDPNNLENARVVTNETVSVPTAVNGQSIYVVKYGPVVMPADPSMTAAQFASYFTVNSPYWTAQSGNSAPSTVVSSAAVSATAAPTPTEVPQETLVTPGQERFLVDLANKKIAVPYAAYTPDGTTSMTTGSPAITVQNANSYGQKIVVAITYFDSSTNTYPTATRYLNVPAATPRDKNNPYAPMYVDALNHEAYLPDTPTSTGSYQGGWFNPEMDYPDSPAGQNPSSLPWVSVTLYRPYNGVLTGHDFNHEIDPTKPTNNDPYQFELTATNLSAAASGYPTSNPGAIGFNPKAAVGSGAQARKVQISYIVSSWGVLREDHDIPVTTGSGTTVIRTTVPNLQQAGAANPDNTIYTGLAGSGKSIIILDLDSGIIIAPNTTTNDPTAPDLPLIDEDTLGTSPDATKINVSFATGRLTFGSQVFTDGKPHRVRIFYGTDLGWTVAVQKAPAYFSEYVTSPAGMATGTTPLGASQFAVDSTADFVYFARCNAGKTVEIDGTYTLSGVTKEFSNTVAVSPVLNSLGDSNVRVNIADGTIVNQPVLPGATALKITAVRGLSARSVVAWKERNVYKVHSVDTVLNRMP